MRPRESHEERSTQLPTPTISAICDDVLGDADAVEISCQIQAGQISVREAVDAAIARAERVNPALNAISNPLFEAARWQADHKRNPGVFGGVPTFVKDSDFVVGSPRSFGSRALSTKPGRLDSAFVKQLLSLGVSILGTSTMSGGPALSLPLAQSSRGLPIGVQLVAPLGQEQTLLALDLATHHCGLMPCNFDIYEHEKRLLVFGGGRR